MKRITVAEQLKIWTKNYKTKQQITTNERLIQNIELSIQYQLKINKIVFQKIKELERIVCTYLEKIDDFDSIINQVNNQITEIYERIEIIQYKNRQLRITLFGQQI